MRGFLVLVLLAGLLVWAAGEVFGQQARVSGSVISVDPRGTTLVLADMGPWRDGDPENSMTRLRVVVDTGTRIVLARRTDGPGPSGWIGDYVEGLATLADIAPGDFVAVELRPGEKGAMADKITLVAVK